MDTRSGRVYCVCMSNEVKISRELAAELLAHLPHAAGCQYEIFWQHNKHLPPQHPAWNFKPVCDCRHRELYLAIRLADATTQIFDKR